MQYIGLLSCKSVKHNLTNKMTLNPIELAYKYIISLGL